MLQILTQKKQTRIQTLRDAINTAVRVYLSKLSRQHLARDYKQLASFSFDHIAHEINLKGIYEKDDLDFFFEWIKTSGRESVFKETAIDIGANIGNHSLYLSDLFREVISFEPNPNTFQLLKFNANLASNIEIHDCGISDEMTEATLCITPENIGSATISKDRHTLEKSIKLNPLDDILDPDKRVSLIKIDVEGHEYQAIKGSRKTIQKYRPIVLLEQHASDFINGKSKAIELLREFGYQQFASIEKGPKGISSFCTPIRFPINLAIRLILGERRELLIHKQLDPRFYSFIIALPD